MPDQLDQIDRDFLIMLHRETAGDTRRVVCGLYWTIGDRSRAAGGSHVVQLGLCTATATEYCEQHTRIHEIAADLRGKR
jgi:hypothetical protein